MRGLRNRERTAPGSKPSKRWRPCGSDQRLKQVRGFRAAKVAILKKSGIFNNTQVTCVGARVGEFANDESDHALIVIRSKERLSAKSITVTGFGPEPENFKLKSLILAQIERWRHA